MNLRLGGALLVVAILLFVLTRTAVHYAFLAIAAYSYPLIDTVEQRVYVPSNQETMTRLQMQSGLGQVAIAPGGTEILSGTAVYNVAEFAPIVEVDVDGDRSQVLMRQRHDLDPTRLVNMGDRVNTLDLRVGTAVPYQSLSLLMGVGQLTLDTAGVTARQVDIFMGTGEVRLVPSGEPFAAEALTVFVGTGAAHVDLHDSNVVSTTIEVGLGEALLDLRDTDAISATIMVGLGDVLLDLRGERSQDGLFRVSAGLGTVTVVLPEAVGVRVQVDGVGATLASDFSQQTVPEEDAGAVYVNAAYATSPVTLDVVVDRGLGTVNLLTDLPTFGFPE